MSENKKCGYFPSCKFPDGECYLVPQIKNQAECGYTKGRFDVSVEERKLDYHRYLERIKAKSDKCANPDGVLATIDSAEPNFD